MCDSERMAAGSGHPLPSAVGQKSLYSKIRKEVLEKAREWVATKPEAPKAQVEDRSFGECRPE